MPTVTLGGTIGGEIEGGEPRDYIDEYGINHGQGVKIGATVWAPVNCGYHATDYKYGKLYQWGRKYGHGYDDDDASVPEIVEGPVSLAVGQSEANAGKFYCNTNIPYDWLTPQDDNLWNSGTEDNPVNTEYDPCPEGWRVPTNSEFLELISNHSSWTIDENDQTKITVEGYLPEGASIKAFAVEGCTLLYSNDNSLPTANSLPETPFASLRVTS